MASAEFRRAFAQASGASAVPVRSTEERRASYRRLVARSRTARTWASGALEETASVAFVLLVIAVILRALI